MTRSLAFVLFLLALVPMAQAGPQPPYRVVSEDGSGDNRRIAVRLDARLPEAELKAIAATFRDKAVSAQTPAVVTFYLPGMALSQSPWAEMRFAPEPRIAINGLRFEEVTAFATEAAADPRDVFGVWLTAPPALPGKLTIWRDKSGKRFADWHLRSGQKTTDELDEIKTSRGRRFEIKGSNGGYYLATWAGALELGEGKTVIAVAERLVIPKETAPKAKPAPVATALPPATDSKRASSPPAVEGASVTGASAKQLPGAQAQASATAAPAPAKPAAKTVVKQKRVAAKSPSVPRGQSVADAIKETMSR